ncbi:MAG: hypothetical protein PSV26_11255 [Polaromonas sp.]|uniref:hypothetical protein n=1 Tax=Polaromonas sp. TaxID=1869339 RepID=UPI00248820F3|nr:hypothetical protein [Polaromonas sp.]MDI1238049.1 hypothetical protein [Polaromonas sp.]
MLYRHQVLVLRSAAALSLCTSAFQANANDLLNNVLQQAIGHVITQGLQNAANPGAPASPMLGSPATPATPSAVQNGPEVVLDNAADFPPHGIIQAWRQPGTIGMAPGPAGAVMGHVEMQTTYGGNLSLPGVATMRAKLDALYSLLLSQPPLLNPQGVSIGPGGGLGHRRGGAVGPTVTGSLVIRAYPLKPDSKTTKRYPDGTQHTPGEGDALNVLVNDTDALRDPLPIGSYNGMTVLRRGGGYQLVVLNTTRPLLVNGVLNRDLIDPARPASDIQFLVIYLGAASPTWSALRKGQLHPASGTGRLLGLMFNTDWRSLLKQIETSKGQPS